MQRLGNRLAPEILFVESGTGAIAVPIDPPTPKRCITADTPAAAYPRSAVVTAAFTGLADANAIAYRSAVVYSANNGASWNSTGTNFSLQAWSPSGQWSGLAPGARIDLEPNLPYRFAIALRRDDVIAGTTGNFSDGRCQLTVKIFSRTGASSPFDAAAQGEAEE